MLVIALLAALPALAASVFHPNRPAWSREVLAPDEITPREAMALTEVVWIDARSRKAFAAEHVPGAFSLNEDEWNQSLLTFASHFQPGQTLVVYCDSLECNASHQVAARLRKELGAEKVRVLKGGWAAWKAER